MQDLNVFDRPRDHQVKRDAVLRAAADMFNKRGYAATSLDEIAARFNITKTSLYYYVGSKPVILQTCYEETLDFCEAAMKHATELEGSGLDKIISYITTMIRDSLDNCAVVIVGEYDCLPEECRSELRFRAKKIDAALLSFINEGIADGSIAPVPARTAELLLMGALNWIHRWYEPGGKSSLTEIADTFVAMFVNGLRNAAVRD